MGLEMWNTVDKVVGRNDDQRQITYFIFKIPKITPKQFHHSVGISM